MEHRQRNKRSLITVLSLMSHPQGLVFGTEVGGVVGGWTHYSLLTTHMCYQWRSSTYSHTQWPEDTDGKTYSSELMMGNSVAFYMELLCAYGKTFQVNLIMLYCCKLRILEIPQKFEHTIPRLKIQRQMQVSQWVYSIQWRLPEPSDEQWTHERDTTSRLLTTHAGVC